MWRLLDCVGIHDYDRPIKDISSISNFRAKKTVVVITTNYLHIRIMALTA